MTQPLDPTLLSRLKALHEKATPGDWTNGGIFNPNTPEASANIWGETPAGFASGECIAEKVLLANAIYIANIHNVLPQLLARIEAQDKRIAELEDELKLEKCGQYEQARKWIEAESQDYNPDQHAYGLMWQERNKEAMRAICAESALSATRERLEVAVAFIKTAPGRLPQEIQDIVYPAIAAKACTGGKGERE